MAFSLPFLLTLTSTLASQEQSPQNPALTTELIGMQMADQEARGRMVQAMQSGGPVPRELAQELSALDRAHSRRMAEILSQFGWPTPRLVGAEAASSAWLLIQHADHDVALQREALRLMEPLLRDKQVRPSEYALLFDRVRVNSKQKQCYGTQFHMVAGVLRMRPCEDVKNLDARRRRVGLPPMREYVRLLQEVYGGKVKV